MVAGAPIEGSPRAAMGVHWQPLFRTVQYAAEAVRLEAHGAWAWSWWLGRRTWQDWQSFAPGSCRWDRTPFPCCNLHIPEIRIGS